MDRVRQCFHTDAFRRNYYPFFFPRLASWKPAKILFASYLYSYSTALSCGSRTVDDLTRQLSASGKLSAGEIALFGVKLRLRSELLCRHRLDGTLSLCQPRDYSVLDDSCIGSAVPAAIPVLQLAAFRRRLGGLAGFGISARAAACGR